MGGGNPRNM